MKYGFTTVFVIVLFVSSNSFAAELHVPSQCPTIQAAINVADDGDEIIVAPGTYNEAIDLAGKAIHLRSSDGPEVTIIDSTGLDTNDTVRCENGEGPGTIIEGFTITGGSDSGMGNSDSSPYVTNCTFSGNGTGMKNGNSSPEVTNCTFSGNTAGMRNTFHSSPYVTNCTFSGNGFGMRNSFHSSPTVTDCIFSDNSGKGMYNSHDSSPIVINSQFLNNTGSGFGGAILSIGDLTVMNCTFVNNSSRHGGAIASLYGNLTAINCTFLGNSADSFGGAIFIQGDRSEVTDSAFSDNSAGSSGGAMEIRSIYVHSSVTVTSCTFLRNSVPLEGRGGGVAIKSYDLDQVAVSVNNSTFSENTAGDGAAMYNWNSSPTISNSIFEGNSAANSGGAMLNRIQWWFATGGQYLGSKGQPVSNPLISGTRFCENAPGDIEGAWSDSGGNDFFQECPVECGTDLNCDGVVDVYDLLIFLSVWGNCDHPDHCPADLNEDGVVDVNDMLLLLTDL